MTQREYELRRQRLDDQLREGVELLEAAHRQQLRALELVWQMSAEDPVAVPEPPAAAGPPPPPRRGTPEVMADLDHALERLPEDFDRNDVCEALGYEPDRHVLYRVLQQAQAEGLIRAMESGSGQRTTRYRKTGAGAPAAEG